MTLFHSAQTPPSTGGLETIVQEGWLSRWLNALAYVVMMLVATGAGLTLIYLWLSDQMPSDLDGFFVVCVFLFCLALTLIGYTSLDAILKRSNWLLRIQPQSLVLKFRSDMNARLPEPHPVVVVLTYSQVRWVRKTREWVRRYSLSSSTGPSKYRAYFIDLKLQLSAEEQEQLREAIDTEIRYKPGAGKPTKFGHFPVRLDDDVLRVQWWRGLKPTLDATLELLQRRIPVERALDLTVDLSTALSPTEAKQKVLELARRGEELAAIGLARRYHGLSLSEAKAFVEDLKGGP